MEYDGYAQDLGWDASSWEGDAEPPTSNSKDWSDLTEEEKEAAGHFCYFMELWDRSDLVTWKGKAWPEDRYYPWSSLWDDEQEFLQDIGFTENTWDNPGTSEVELKAWSDLHSSQRHRLIEWGFYESQWDCFMNHFEGYEWDELVLEGVVDDMMTLGYTEETWSSGQDPPSYKYDWADLTDSQRDAAWNICYFEMTWNDVPLPEWDSSVRSGGGSYDDDDDYSSDDDDDDGRGALVVIVLILLIAAALAGFACGRLTSFGSSCTDQRETTNSNNDKTDDVTDTSMEAYNMEFGENHQPTDGTNQTGGGDDDLDEDGKMDDVPVKQCHFV